MRFSARDRTTRRIIGDLPVAVYHHTASGVLAQIKQTGLRSWRDTNVRRPANEHMNSGAGVYVTTETGGPVVDGYLRIAQRVHGGHPVSLTIRTTLDALTRDPDDVDLSVGAHQFVLSHVLPGDIVDGLGTRRGKR
jgi:hypothetical protein